MPSRPDGEIAELVIGHDGDIHRIGRGVRGNVAIARSDWEAAKGVGSDFGATKVARRVAGVSDPARDRRDEEKTYIKR